MTQIVIRFIVGGLIEKNAREKKRKAGLDGARRGRMEAAVDAAGASIGTLGLLVFAALIWGLMPGHRPWMVLLSATVIWLAVSVAVWKIRKVQKGFSPASLQYLAATAGIRSDGTERLQRVAHNAIGIFP